MSISLLLYTIYLLGHPEIGTPIVNQDYMVTLVNQERTKVKVEPLIQNSLLIKSATNKACDILNNDYWSHYSPSGKSPWAFINEVGYKYEYAGENLCKNFNDTQCMSAFMQSSTHKDNILSSNYKEIGIGKCGNITVQHFGTK